MPAPQDELGSLVDSPLKGSIDGSNVAASDAISKWLSERLELERMSLLSELEQRLVDSHQHMVSELGAVIQASKEQAAIDSVDVVTAGEVNVQTNLCITPDQAPPSDDKGHIAPRPPNSQPCKQNGGDASGDDPIAPKDKEDGGMVETTPSGKYLEPQQPENCVEKFVESSWFELISQFLILSNVVCMALQIQYVGYDWGYNLRVASSDQVLRENSIDYLEHYVEHAEAHWPRAGEMLEGLDYFFNAAFTVELLLRIYGMRSKALRCGWIWFDTVLVTTNLLEMTNVLAIDPSALRSIRLIRVLRTARLGRLASAFEDLFLLVRSIRASLGALFWSFILLLILQLGVGMLFNQALTSFIEDDSNDFLRRAEVFNYFGTFTRTMITMFEITFANWVPSCRVIMKVSEWYAYWYVFYRCVLLFGMVKVITAVFIAETNRVVASDEEITKMKRKKATEDKYKKLSKMFHELDEDHDGVINYEEFERLALDPRVGDMAAALDVQVVDLEHLFKTIDELSDGDGKINIDEFMEGLVKMKAPAVGIDLINVVKCVEKLDKKVTKMGTSLIAPGWGRQFSMVPRRSRRPSGNMVMMGGGGMMPDIATTVATTTAV